MVLAYHGRELSEDELARLPGTTRAGTDFLDLQRLESLGFEVRTRAGTFRDLLTIANSGLPLIVAVHTLHLPTYPAPGGPHCVVAAGATRARVEIYDPDRPRAPEQVPAPAFEAAWRRRQYRMARLLPRPRTAGE
jgi:ABC-type bacteriocin/lantibiotic exporter with double-glycine peptidase domain